MELRSIALLSVIVFSVLSMFLVIQHEIHLSSVSSDFLTRTRRKNVHIDPPSAQIMNLTIETPSIIVTTRSKNETHQGVTLRHEYHQEIIESREDKEEEIGKLVCDGKEIDSEVIYWKIVPGDDVYESPITPHHDRHHDRYVTFEYDHGGWNNVRMGLECMLVIAHAMGRTLTLPPAQHLYLLGTKQKDQNNKDVILF